MPKRPTRRILVGFRLVEALRDVLEGITRYVKRHERNWRVQCVDADEFGPHLRHPGIDGALTVISPASRSMIQKVRRSGVPVVNLLHNVHPLLPSVLSDDFGLGAAGAQYLMGLGFRHFAFLGISSQWSHRREAGFTRALAAAGRACHCSGDTFQTNDYRLLGSRQSLNVMRRWLRALPRPLAVMACADFVARTLLVACEQSDRRVPDDVAILGVDNLVTTCELASPPLSSVAQDFAGLGYEAAELLDKLMSGRRPPRSAIVVAPGKVIARRSTEIFAFEDRNVASAMRLIHERAGEGISVKELMRSIPGSRKWLDIRFKAAVGRTPSQEIRRVRLMKIHDLLLQSELSIQQIAARSGFSRGENLIRFFRDAQGVPPHQYRSRRPAMEV